MATKSEVRDDAYTPATRPAVATRISARWVGSLLLLVLSLLLSAGVGLVAAFEIRYQERIFPGVRVNSVDLGGMTPAEADAFLTQAFGQSNVWWPLLRYEGSVWMPTQQELGAAVDVEDTLRRAYAVGRSRRLSLALAEQWNARQNGHAVQPSVRFDRAQARRYLGTLSPLVSVPVREASLRVLGTAVELTPSQIGYELDEAATLEALEKRVLAGQGGEVELVVRQVLPVVTDLSGLGERVERIIAHSIELIGPAGARRSHWGILPDELAQMLVIQQKVEGGKVVGIAALSEPALLARAESMAKELDQPATEGQVDFDMRQKKLVVKSPSQTGYKLDVAKTAQMIQEQSLSAQRTISLPVEILHPIIDTNNLASLGIVDQVVKATTNFKGSSKERMNNIKQASARFDGVLVAPKEIFSFNKYLGDVTAELGYSESLIIWGDRTAVGIGGGICQVSTTAFRAAFYAGLEILERTAHGYRVGWYEPPVGLDATVFSPVVDFKFRNDTEGYLLIKTEFDEQAGSLTFYFFGTPTGRTVELVGPAQENVIAAGAPEYRDDPSLPAGTSKQVEWPVNGVNVTVKRIVKLAGQVIREDTFFSRYQPWRAVYLVGKKTE